jgi:hypothetical protein
MAENFGELVAAARATRRLRFGALARLLLGPEARAKQISRMAMRLVSIERDGRRDRRLVAEIIRVLDIDRHEATELLARERAEQLATWQRWTVEPVDPVLHVAALPGVWISRQLAGMSEVHAVGVASHFAREKRLRVCLALDRRLSVWFDELGVEYARTEAMPGDTMTPLMTIGGHRVVFRSESEFNSSDPL